MNLNLVLLLSAHLWMMAFCGGLLVMAEKVNILIKVRLVNTGTW